jgi:peptidoglycan/LPS O-acetylase OafA/YrhL
MPIPALLKFDKTFADESCSRNNNLDGLRLAFALSVIFSHAFFLFGRVEQEPVYAFSKGNLDLGKLAVNAFFVISGFLIAMSWVRSKSLWDYSKKRIARIYPGFIVALFVCAFIVAPLGGAAFPEWLQQSDTYKFIYRPLLFRHLRSIDGVFPYSAMPDVVNSPLWTIRFELLCYILLALAGLAGLMKHRVVMLALFIGALAYYRVMPWVIEVPYFDFLGELPRFVTYFLAGTVAYLWRDIIPRSGLLAAACFAILLASRGRGVATLWPILFSYLVLYVGMTRQLPLLRHLKDNDISYGVYLYGWPSHQIVIHYFPNIPFIPSTLLAVALTCVLGFLSWRFVEKPFLMRARGRAAHGPVGTPRECAATVVPTESGLTKAAA